MPRPLLLPPGQRRRSACAADHLLAILVSMLPPCVAAAVLAVHRTFDHLELCERSLQICTTASSRCADFKVGQASMDAREREMYRNLRRCVGRRLCYGFDSRPCATSREDCAQNENHEHDPHRRTPEGWPWRLAGSLALGMAYGLNGRTAEPEPGLASTIMHGSRLRWSLEFPRGANA